jgi:hypothetical protein
MASTAAPAKALPTGVELKAQLRAYRTPQATPTNEYPEKKLSEYKVMNELHTTHYRHIGITE